MIKGIYDHIQGKIDVTLCNIDSLRDDIELIQDPTGAGSSFLRTNENLNDVLDKEKALSNLGIDKDFINTVTQSISVCNLSVKSLKYTNLSDDMNGKFLTVDVNGDTNWAYVPLVTISTSGNVIVDDSLCNLGDIHRVFSRRFIQGEFENLEDQYESVLDTISKLNEETNERIPTSINDLIDDGDYLTSTNYLSELTTDLVSVYSNLNLEEVAWTGSYNSLTGIPVHLDDKEMNKTYLQKANYLSDFEGNYETIRSNLGLGDMALQSSSNLIIHDGVIHNLTSIRTDELILDSNVPNFSSLSNILFMKAIDANGTAGWDTLPKSGFAQPGLIYTINTDRELSAFNETDYLSVYTTNYINEQLSILSIDIDNTKLINAALTVGLCNLQAEIAGLDNTILNDLTLCNLYYRTDETDYDYDSECNQYNKVLTRGDNGLSEWMSVSNIFGSLSFTKVNRVDLHQVTAINTQSLDVYESIQFDDGKRDPAKNIPNGSIIYSDDNGRMHWRNFVRFSSDLETQLGFEFEQRDESDSVQHTMLFYQKDGQMIIAQRDGDCNNVITKHIFR
jgi:hypothetical protein